MKHTTNSTHTYALIHMHACLLAYMEAHIHAHTQTQTWHTQIHTWCSYKQVWSTNFQKFCWEATAARNINSSCKGETNHHLLDNSNINTEIALELHINTHIPRRALLSSCNTLPNSGSIKYRSSACSSRRIVRVVSLCSQRTM